MKESDPKAPSFETMMKRLEELVHRMERGDLSLEESIKSFEEGNRLVKQCRSVLDQAEKRIQDVVADAKAEPGTGEERGDDELPF